MVLDRREFSRILTGGLGLAGASNALQTAGSGSAPVPILVNGAIEISGYVSLPDPQKSGIEHIVVVTMENRSFDHFLGWIPIAGQQALTYTDAHGVSHATYPLAPDYTGCGHPSPDHSYSGGRVEYDGGKMDGFLRAGSNDIYAIGYYVAKDIPFYAALAKNYTVCDRYFASILGPTYPNRMFLWSAQTDRLNNSITLSSLPTIFDRLSAAGISHRYYFSNVPYLALWGLKYLFSTSTLSTFLTEATAGTLPAVSFVDPRFTIIDDGTGDDDEPHSDIRNGDAFLSTVFHALTASKAWANTVLIITFDEWGGFFEHVAPPRTVAPNNTDTDKVNGEVLLGFRVPTVIASPFTRSGGSSPNISSVVFDHTSILKLIEWRWNLAPLTARDASDDIGNPAVSMNFASPDAHVPVLPVANPVAVAPCSLSGAGGILSSAVPSERTAGPSNVVESASEWAALASSPAVQQWLTHPRFAQTPPQ